MLIIIKFYVSNAIIDLTESINLVYRLSEEHFSPI